MSTIESPGSLVEFAERQGIDPSQAQQAYTEELEAYRFRLADFLGITLDDLHDKPLQTTNVSESVSV